MYGGKNTLIRASVDRRAGCQPGCKFLEKLVFREKIKIPRLLFEDGGSRVTTSIRHPFTEGGLMGYKLYTRLL